MTKSKKTTADVCATASPLTKVTFSARGPSQAFPPVAGGTGNDVTCSITPVIYADPLSYSVPYPVNRTEGGIVRPKSQNDNQCLFFAVLNSLDTSEQRDAFSFGHPECPDVEFQAFIKAKFGRGSTHGYHASDIFEYLKHLKNHGFIKDFNWKVLGNFHIQDLFVDVQRRPRFWHGNNVIMFGRATATDVAPKVKKEVLSVSRRQWEQLTHEEKSQQIQAYVDKSSALAKESFPKHAVGIKYRRDKNRIVRGVLVDSAKFVAKPLTPTALADSMTERIETGTDMMYESDFRVFNITLNKP